MDQGTFQRVRRIISDYQEISIDEVKVDSLLLEDLGIDSLGWLDILLEVEDEFDVVVPESQAVGFTTVGAVCEGIEALLVLNARVGPRGSE